MCRVVANLGGTGISGSNFLNIASSRARRRALVAAAATCLYVTDVARLVAGDARNYLTIEIKCDVENRRCKIARCEGNCQFYVSRVKRVDFNRIIKRG